MVFDVGFRDTRTPVSRLGFHAVVAVRSLDFLEHVQHSVGILLVQVAEHGGCVFELPAIQFSFAIDDFEYLSLVTAKSLFLRRQHMHCGTSQSLFVAVFHEFWDNHDSFIDATSCLNRRSKR